MKVITVFEKLIRNSKYPLHLKCIFSLMFLAISIPLVNSQCKLSLGCIGREKYLSYAPMIGTDGERKDSQSIVDYKVIYLLSDRLVFYQSTKPDTSMLEVEDLRENAQKIQSRVIRSINYGEIILDCGQYHNKLCHAQEYPQIEKIASFKKVNQKITSQAEVLCIVIPFFENAYKLAHEKIAFICVKNPEDLGTLIAFKHKLSRLIEKTQLKMSNDRFSRLNGLLRRRAPFITVYNHVQTSVIAKLHSKRIVLLENDQDEKFIRQYSLYQMRLPDNNAWIASEALSTGMIDENFWYGGLSPPPNPDCCIFFKGDLDNLVLCLPTPDGSSIETASDVCKHKINPFMGDVSIFVNGIKYAEAFHELAHDVRKLNNCKSKEYALMDIRVQQTIKYAIEVDCKLIFHYMKNLKSDAKLQLCQQNYLDQIRLEEMQMGDENKKILKGIKTCVYDSKNNAKIFTENYLMKLLSNAKIFSRPLSFIEIDDLDDDDGYAGHVKEGKIAKHLIEKNNKKKAADKDDEVNFVETKSFAFAHNKNTNGNKNSFENSGLHLPKKNKENHDEMTIVFRNTKMKELQKTHTWQISSNESMKSDYDPKKSSKGAGSVDEFMNFLGFLGDNAKLTSEGIEIKQKEKLAAAVPTS